MDLLLKRKTLTDKSTIGELYVNGIKECYTLEDKVREPGVKVKGETAIPIGMYKVIVDFSNRFQKQMPHVLDVPMFEGIRIHSGNTAENTEGCILLGTVFGVNQIFNSKIAFNGFFPKLLQAIKNKEKVTIQITNPQ